MGRNSDNQQSVNFSVSPITYSDFRRNVVIREKKSRYMSVVIQSLMDIYNVLPDATTNPDEINIRAKTAVEMLISMGKIPKGYDVKITVVNKNKPAETK